MSTPTTPPTVPTATSRPQIGHGDVQDCGQEHPISQHEGNGMILSSVDYKVDDTHAPDHFLVHVTYGMYYKPEGWSYKSYTLKLQGNANGDLRYEMVAGDDKNLISSDTHAQAGPFLMYSEGFRLYFGCRTRYLSGERNPKLAVVPNCMTHDLKSLCLKTA